MPGFEESLREALDELRAKSLYRSLVEIESPQAERVRIGRRWVSNFCSNNYLGLASREELREVAQKALREWGTGSGASRLICGNFSFHRKLEERIACFEGTEDALLFSTGYMANLAVITSLASEEDEIFLDRSCHASIFDGVRLSGARFRTYRHNDPEDLERRLKERRGRRVLVITDGVFSVEGDIAPLKEIYRLSRRYEAILMVDDAHGTGVLGDRGRGSAELYGLEGKVDVLVGTLSKAVGSLGGFVAGDHLLIEYLRNRARSFIFTTAPPAPICASAEEGLKIIEREPQLRHKLWENIELFARRLQRSIKPPQSAIVPLVVGDAQKAVELAERLLERGFLVRALRPPTVKPGRSSLRITFMSTHSPEQILSLCQALRELHPPKV